MIGFRAIQPYSEIRAACPSTGWPMTRTNLARRLLAPEFFLPAPANPCQGYSTLFNPARSRTPGCRHLSPIIYHFSNAAANCLCALCRWPNLQEKQSSKDSESLRKNKKVFKSVHEQGKPATSN
jgi:hypothetical protein